MKTELVPIFLSFNLLRAPGYIQCIASSLITGHFKWKPDIWKLFFAVLPYQGVSESLTEIKLKGAFLVMGLELEKKHTIKKVRQLEKNFQF